MVLVLAACGGHKASQPTQQTDSYVIESCVGSSRTVGTGKDGQIMCSDGIHGIQVPKQAAAVAEIKRYLRRHPSNTDVRSMGCRPTSEAVTCTITLSRGCVILAVKGPSRNPWVVPGFGTCTRVK
jgi:hypothetical protein